MAKSFGRDRIVRAKVMTEVGGPGIDVDRIYSTLIGQVTAGVQKTLVDAFDQARIDVPVRKVFKYGRKNVGSRIYAEQRIQGRQETRVLSLEEALGESLIRRKLGLSSAFPTIKTGKGQRRIPGTQPMVKTAGFDTYRAKNRANKAARGDEDDRRSIIAVFDQESRRYENRIGSFETTYTKDAYGRDVPQETRAVINEAAEADLSVEGRHQLRIANIGSNKQGTLGGALRKSIRIVPAGVVGRRVKGKVVAGGGEVDYAKYVEFGTRRSRAQPFLRPALAKAREELGPNLKDALTGQSTL